MDDCCIIAKEEREIEETLTLLRQKYTITDEGKIEEYLGVQIDPDGNKMRMSHPHLINRIIEAIPGVKKANPVKYSALPLMILTEDIFGENQKEKWNYRSLIGMLNYLVNSTHPELAYAVHQCARFCNDPKRSHKVAVWRILQYLMSTRMRNPDGSYRENEYEGLLLTINKHENVEVYVDKPFAGDWNKSWIEDPLSVFSCTGYIIKYANCPIIWLSKLQSEITLFTTEAKYVGLSQSLRDAIPLMLLLGELKEILPITVENPKIHCTVFEDNNSCIQLVKCPKMRPRTKHIRLKYHRFHSKVQDSTITIEHIDGENHPANLLTKALPKIKFLTLRKLINRW